MFYTVYSSINSGLFLETMYCWSGGFIGWRLCYLPRAIISIYMEIINK